MTLAQSLTILLLEVFVPQASSYFPRAHGGVHLPAHGGQTCTRLAGAQPPNERAVGEVGPCGRVGEVGQNGFLRPNGAQFRFSFSFLLYFPSF
jgi:hypothetical protein